MQFFNIPFSVDIWIILGFLLLNLLIGLVHARNVNTIENYALGGRKFSTFTLTATIVATWIAGDDFPLYISETYSEGLCFIVGSCGGLFCFIIMAYIYIPRMKRFLGIISLATAMEKLYGQYASLITIISSIFLSIAQIAMQFKFISILMIYIFDISGIYATALSATIIIAYSSLGGLRSVIFTDSIQFLLFCVIIPCIICYCWNKIENYESIIYIIQNNEVFDVTKLFDYQGERFWKFITLFLLFFIPGIDGSMFQRISISQNIKQSTHAFASAGIIITILRLLIASVSIIILSQDNNLTSDGVFYHLLDNLSFPGAIAIFVICLLSMMMSSIDSDLNASSVMIANDFLYKFKFIKEKQILIFARASSVIIGVLSFLLAMGFDSLFELFMLGYSFYMPVVTAPITFAIFGFRTTEKTALAGMVSGFLVSFIWLFINSNIDSVIPGLIVNALVMLLYHYITNQTGGWTPKYPADNTIEEDLQLAFKRFVHFNFKRFCAKHYPENKLFYLVYSGICIGSTIISKCFIDINIIHQNITNIIYLVTLCSAIFFMLYGIFKWYISYKKIFALVWIINCIYTLIIAPTLLLILSNYDATHVFLMFFSTIFFSMLISWKESLICIVSTIIVTSLLCHKFLIVQSFLESNLFILCMISIISVIFILLIKPRQDYYELILYKLRNSMQYGLDAYDFLLSSNKEDPSETKFKTLDNQALENTINNISTNVISIGNIPIIGSDNFNRLLSEGLKHFEIKQILSIESIIYNAPSFLSLEFLNLLDVATLDTKLVVTKNIIDSRKTSKELYSLKEMINERVGKFNELYLKNRYNSFSLSLEENVFVTMNIYYAKQIIDNLLFRIVNYYMYNDCVIVLSSSNQNIELIINYESHYPITNALRFIDIDVVNNKMHKIMSNPFTTFPIDFSKKNIIHNVINVGLPFCRNILEIYNGVINFNQTALNKGEFVVKLPHDNEYSRVYRHSRQKIRHS